LIGKVINDHLLTEVSEVASKEADPPSDVHGSAEYRREMVKVYVKRVAVKALERARER
jgi:CO/xanthine dehydrogenase FAD-binding subunit